ncbi:uncharacterized protein [Panulirus ornatus]|uniref:uncharacterized protein n=1 Tax=Panulirus ornatus TaxID=150431 RepID=UPI003A835CDF
MQKDGLLDTDTYMLLHLQPFLAHPPPLNNSCLLQDNNSTESNTSCLSTHHSGSGNLSNSSYRGNDTVDEDPSLVPQWENDRTGENTYDPQEEEDIQGGYVPHSSGTTTSSGDDDNLDNTTTTEVALVTTAARPSSSSPDMLENFTLCIFFSVFFFTEYGTVLSYYAREKSDAIRISVLHVGLYIMLGEKCRRMIDLRIYPNTWCHLCLVATQTQFKLYNHGQLLETWSCAPDKLPLGGVLVLGQDQDTLGGGFSLGQAFRGRVSLLQLWPHHLTVKEMDSLDASEQPLLAGALFPWASPPWQMHGRVHSATTSNCNHRAWTLFPFQKPSTYDKAVAYLQKLGMVMSTPSSKAHLTQIVELVANLSVRCSSPYEAGRYIMINAYYNHHTNTVTNLASNKTVQILTSSNNQTHRNSGTVYLRDKGEWGVQPPYHQSSSCYMGEYQHERPVFTLWGLCHNEYMRKYVKFVLSVNNEKEIYFAGLYGLKIEKAGSTWSVFHLCKNMTLATVESATLPLGYRYWNLTGEDEDCTITSGLQPLTLSPCNHNNHFTCKDGTCVNMTARCDLTSDCNDWSDEQNCELVSLPEGYLVHLPPQPPINMKLYISFDNIEVDLLKMKVRLEINYQLIWYDTRITFLNLRDDAASNLVMPDTNLKMQVWVPQVDISPTVDYVPFQDHIISVSRNTTGQVYHNNMMYKGETNPMNLSKLIMPTLRCPFSLKLYPWDEQQCRFRFSITNVKSDSIKFIAYSFNYTGRKVFDEYCLFNWNIDVSNNTAFLSFKLQRQVNKHIWSTYVPTALLLGISYGTLYIPAESFTDRGTMSLTTLLVLVSLYTESLSSLPTTAYNKHIDLWYLFIIVYVSLIIAVHLVTSNFHSTDTQSTKVFTDRLSRKGRWFHHINTTTILKTAQLIFALAFIIYVLYYVYLLC